jgi:hypothetical protein
MSSVAFEEEPGTQQSTDEVNHRDGGSRPPASIGELADLSSMHTDVKIRCITNGQIIKLLTANVPVSAGAYNEQQGCPHLGRIRLGFMTPLMIRCFFMSW